LGMMMILRRCLNEKSGIAVLLNTIPPVPTEYLKKKIVKLNSSINLYTILLVTILL